MLRRSLIPVLIAIFVAALVSAASRAEPLSNLSIANFPVTEGTDSEATFEVTLDVASGVDITFDYATSDFTASAGEDYTDASGQLTIPAGATQAFIPVPLINDTLDELEETFTVTLSGAVGGGLDDFEGMATISDNDAAPQVSIGDATVTEGTDFDTVEATFDVTLDAPSGQTVTVDYSTTNGTATEPGDYTEVTTSTVVFAPGQTTQPATVIVNGDDVDEANETFSVDLANPSEATIGDGHAVGTIIDNDGPAISIDNVSVTEGNVGTVTANFTLSLSAPSPQEVTVEYETIDDTATAGEDYVAVDAVATFAPGQTEQTAERHRQRRYRRRARRELLHRPLGV